MIPGGVQLWWARLAKARKIMLVAIGVLFVSQFFEYRDNTGWGMLTHTTDTTRYTGYVYSFGPSAGTGWQLHPFAPLLILALAAVYLSGLQQGAWWRRWGYWLSCGLVLVAEMPSAALRTLGGGLGLAALGLAVWAALANMAAQRVMPRG